MLGFFQHFKFAIHFQSLQFSLDLIVMASMQLAIEGVVNAIFHGSNDFTKTNVKVQFALCRTFGGYFAWRAILESEGWKKDSRTRNFTATNTGINMVHAQ
ncbi:hypothetical protein DEO72_LG8g2564 [Vigna unguiculata]|uniref:Uncharacterized protein n=1 Tax=Vigna unguiculata TaxID=3917 RepID=A0A4D6MTT6_VIGUN|nr:hypothetical protein DEO72_LG8g2564 [Vigna unguiculata]